MSAGPLPSSLLFGQTFRYAAVCSSFSFFWMDTGPSLAKTGERKQDRHMWFSMDRLAASAPELRSFIAGSTTELALAIRWKRLTLAEVKEKMNLLGWNFPLARLENTGIRILSEMGWRSTEQCAWSNGHHTFRLKHIAQGSKCRKGATHKLRQQRRKCIWPTLGQLLSRRREISRCIWPVWSEQRVNRIRRMAVRSTPDFMVTTLGVQGYLSRSMGAQGISLPCHCCSKHLRIGIMFGLHWGFRFLMMF